MYACVYVCVRAVRLESNRTAKENKKKIPFAHKSGTSQTLPAAPRPRALRFAAQAPFQVCRTLGQARAKARERSCHLRGECEPRPGEIRCVVSGSIGLCLLLWCLVLR
jgi:hypothetical protein